MRYRFLTIDVLLVFVFFLLIFTSIMFWPMLETDLPVHVYIAREKLSIGDIFRGNFIFYFLVCFFTFFSGNIFAMRIASCVLLAGGKTVCYWMVRDNFAQFCSKRIAALSSLCMMLIFVIPVFYYLGVFDLNELSSYMYLGHFVPNVWHNSTIIFSMPFAIGMYLLSLKQFKVYERHNNQLLTILTALCVLVKPSFFFIFSISYPIILFFKCKSSSIFLKSLMPVVVGILCMIYVYMGCFNDDSAAGISISFTQLLSFDFWTPKFKYISVSMALPLIFLCLNFRECIYDSEFWYVFIMLFVAILISFTCQETGNRASDGNFGWQVIPAMWLTYYYILKTVIKNFKLNKNTTLSLDKKNMLIISFLLLHVISGIIYLARIFLLRTYY